MGTMLALPIRTQSEPQKWRTHVPSPGHTLEPSRHRSGACRPGRLYHGRPRPGPVLGAASQPPPESSSCGNRVHPAMRSATVFRPPSPGGGGYQCSNAVPSHKQDLEWEMAGADLYTVALFVGGGVRIEGVLPRREGGLRSAHPSRRWIGGGGQGTSSPQGSPSR